MGVPYTFATATTSIPLSELDANFNTPVTIGTSTVGLGNTITSISNLTLTNVTVVSGTSNATQNLANVTGTLASANGGTGQSNITFPSSGGTAMISGNMPAFSAYQSSAQTITGGSFTKVTCQTKEFDTNSNYDNATNYRFTPTVAGYYQFNAALQITTSTSTGLICFYKNGAEFKRPSYLSGSSVVNSNGGTALIYCNGSTDYIEFYALLGTGQALSTGVFSTWFQGVMVRSA